MQASSSAAPRARQLLYIGLALALFVLPLVVTSEYRLGIATQMGVYVLVAIGLNLLTGYGGQVSLGHGALVAVGAYCTALTTVDLHWSFWSGAALGMGVTAAVGALMALPAFRLSTWYFALITLGFAQVVEGLLTEWRGLTHGFAGVVGIQMPSLLGYTFLPRDLYWLILAIVIAAMLMVANLLRSRFGRALMAVRDNPAAAAASGVSLVSIKMFAFVFSAAIAGLAGALFAAQQSPVITPDHFTADFHRQLMTRCKRLDLFPIESLHRLLCQRDQLLSAIPIPNAELGAGRARRRPRPTASNTEAHPAEKGAAPLQVDRAHFPPKARCTRETLPATAGSGINLMREPGVRLAALPRPKREPTRARRRASRVAPKYERRWRDTLAAQIPGPRCYKPPRPFSDYFHVVGLRLWSLHHSPSPHSPVPFG